MKECAVVIFCLAFMIPCGGENLRGGSGTDIDNYCVVFDQETIDTCKPLYLRWQQNDGWNKYKVTTIGNSNTYDTKHWEGFNGNITGIANASEMNAFKDSTFAANHWCSPDSSKGGSHGNLPGTTLRWDVRRWVCDNGLIPANKPMVAPVMIGTNDINTEWDGPPRISDYNALINCILADGVIPIITTIPPINREVWAHTWDPDSLLVPYNDSLRMIGEQKKIPLLDLHRWCMDHGGPTQLLVDWAHAIGCGSNGAVFTDDCLDGGTSGGLQNARNYLLLIALHDIFKYVVDGEPYTKICLNTGVASSTIDMSIGPNPLSSSTTISVYPAGNAGQNISVRIYDSNGKVVKAFEKGKQGTQKGLSVAGFRWDSSGCPPGVYIVKAQVFKQVISKMVVVVR